MIDSRAMDLDMEDNMISNDVILLYKPKSDFINLTNLSQVEIAKKEKAIKRRESEKTGRTSALKGWIWENVVGVMDIITSTVEENEKVVQTSDGELKMSIDQSALWEKTGGDMDIKGKKYFFKFKNQKFHF